MGSQNLVSSTDLLTALLPEWQLLLQGWSASGRLSSAARQALVLQDDPPVLTDLVTQWSAGDFSGLPPIVLLSATDISGAMGAYAISTGTIYLSADWLAAASKEQVFAVLTEELGHHLDGLLNVVDTVGDEGQLFADLLKGEKLSNEQVSALRSQDDKLIIRTTKMTSAEAAVLDFASSISINKDAIVQGSLINLVSVDHGYGSAWSKESIDLSKDWSTSFTFQAGGGSGTSDGYTFVINGDPSGLSAIGDGGGNMGFFGWDTGAGGGVRNSYAVTFRMWYNYGPASVIGFAASSDIGDSSDYQQAPILLANNSYATQIAYSARTKTLSASLGEKTFTKVIDLASAVGTSAFLGFTAANGGGTMDMYVSNWDINSSSYSQVPVIRGNSLYTIVDGPSWTEAEANAVKCGGHLVTVNTMKEGQFLVDNFGKQRYSAFIGLNDIQTEGKLVWIDGTDISRTDLTLLYEGFWRLSQPPNNPSRPNDEDYGCISLQANLANSGHNDWGIDIPALGYMNITNNSGGGNFRETPVGIAEIPFIRRGDSAYVIVQGNTWEEAEANAVKLGGHLVQSDSKEETDFLRQAFYPIDNSVDRQVYWQGLITAGVQNDAKWNGSGGSFYWDLIAGLREPIEITASPGQPPFVSNWKQGIAEIKLAPNNAPTGTPSIAGTLRARSTLTIDASSIQDADNFTGWSPTYQYSWEVSTDGTTWNKLTSADATDSNATYILTAAELGKQIRGVVSYLDGYGTIEVVNSDASLLIEAEHRQPIIRGNSLYTIVDGPSWLEAEENSLKLGGHLTAIRSQQEQNFLANLLADQFSWIGLSDRNQEGFWEWSNGESVGFTAWAEEKPFYEENDYALMHPDYGGLWVDKFADGPVGIAETSFIRRGDSAYVIVQGPTWEEAEANAVKLGGHLASINDAGEDDYIYQNIAVKVGNGVWIGGTDKDQEGVWRWADGSQFYYSNWREGEPNNNVNGAGLEGEDYTQYVVDALYNGKWNDISNNYQPYQHATMFGIAEIKLSLNSFPAGAPTIIGALKVGSTLTIDASSIQDADNFTGWSPAYQYSWEVSTDGATWSKLTSTDATDNDTSYTLTGAEAGKQIHGVVSYLDGYGTNEVLFSQDSTPIQAESVDFTQSNSLLIVGPGFGSIDGLPFSSTYTISLGSGSDAATLTSGAGTITQMSVDGGEGTDTFYGNENNNVLILTGINQGIFDGVSFIGFENVDLKSGDDVVYIRPGGQLTGSLNGGTGGRVVLLPPGENPPPPTLPIVGPPVPPPPTPPETPIQLPISPQGSVVDGGYNSIYLNDNSNTVSLIGLGSGIADGTSFINFYSIDLRGGHDTAVIQDGGLLPGILDGGAGDDQLILNSSENALTINQDLISSVSGAAIKGFENIDLSGGDDTAQVSIDYLANDSGASRQSLYLDGGEGIDSLALKITPQEITGLKSQGLFTNLKNYLENPTGQSLTIALSSVDLTLTGFESVTFFGNEPYGITLSRALVPENLPVDQVVATIGSIDDDFGDAFTYALVAGGGDADNGAFFVSDNSLFLSVSPDYEAKSAYSIRLKTTDSGGLSFEKAFTINIGNLQEGDGVLSSITAAEGSTCQEGVTLTAGSISGDPDGNGNITGYQWYRNNSAISGATGSTFSVDATGFGTYKVAVTYSDGQGYSSNLMSAEQAVAKIDNGSGMASAITAQGGAAFLEGVILLAGSVSGDLDGDGVITAYQWYRNGVALAGATSASLNTTSTGQGSYQVALSAVDGQGFSSTLLSSAQVVAFNPAFKHAPLDIALSATAFDETITAYGLIGTLSSIDPDAGSRFTYSLVAGDGDVDNASFVLSGNQLLIKTTANYEAKASYSLRIRSRDQDGLFVDKAFSLTVNDINEKPTDLLASATSFAENMPLGSVVANLSTSDPDGGESFTYALVAGSGDADNTAFSITGNQLILNGSADFEAKSVYSIRLRSTDHAGLFVEKRLTLRVDDVNEAPTALRLTSDNFNENLAAGSTVALLSSSDPDLFNSFSYALVSGSGGDDNAAFSISGNRLMINASPDYEAKRSYAIRLRSTDQGGLFFEREISLKVNNVVEKVSAYTSTVLDPSKDSLQLYGTANLSATGNQADNTIIGNSGNNAITGGLGKDVLTGGAGLDRFLYNNRQESLFSGYDVITDYSVGEAIVAPWLVANTSLTASVGNLANLDATSISTLLTSTRFQPQQVAAFTVQGFSGCFLAFNDAQAGFQVATDAIVQLQGYNPSASTPINVVLA
jgi:Lectin C-type domain/RTX calcium-binding nonapeptide repeat (4 copies)